jgi:hypothetical protein
MERKKTRIITVILKKEYNEEDGVSHLKNYYSRLIIKTM